MLGSKSTFFPDHVIFVRDRVFHLLDAKGYSAEQIAVYIKAFDYLEKPDDFDGATIVKDLMDVPGIDLTHRLPLRRM
jgi:hypothetical protein